MFVSRQTFVLFIVFRCFDEIEGLTRGRPAIYVERFSILKERDGCLKVRLPMPSVSCVVCPMLCMLCGKELSKAYTIDRFMVLMVAGEHTCMAWSTQHTPVPIFPLNSFGP